MPVVCLNHFPTVSPLDVFSITERLGLHHISLMEKVSLQGVLFTAGTETVEVVVS